MCSCHEMRSPASAHFDSSRTTSLLPVVPRSGAAVCLHSHTVGNKSAPHNTDRRRSLAFSLTRRVCVERVVCSCNPPAHTSHEYLCSTAIRNEFMVSWLRGAAWFTCGFSFCAVDACACTYNLFEHTRAHGHTHNTAALYHRLSLGLFL